MRKKVIRISKLISHYGFCSRREAEKLINSGKVKINGKVISDYTIDDDHIENIEIENKKLIKPLSTRVWIMNKPPGYICSNRRQGSKKIIFDIIPQNIQRVVLVGRLDMYSEGLILLTSNPGLSSYLENPKNKISRKYIVEINELISEEMIKKVSSGIFIKDAYYNKMKINMFKKLQKVFLQIELKEGKNREIRNIVEFCGKKIKTLKRISFGPFSLSSQKAGEINEVSSPILQNKIKQLGLRVEDYFWL